LYTYKQSALFFFIPSYLGLLPNEGDNKLNREREPEAELEKMGLETKRDVAVKG